MVPYQNVLWLSNAVLQASIVILTVVAALLTFFLAFTWSHLQKAKELELKELKALNDGRSLARKLMQMYRSQIVRVYDSWLNEKPEDIEKVVEVVSRHPVISRINARQRLLLFLFGPRFFTEFLPSFAFVLGLFVFLFILAQKWIYLRFLWVTFCILSGMPIDAVRKDTLSFPLISPALFFFAIVRSSPVVKAFQEHGISELKMGKLGSIKFNVSDTETNRKYLKPEIVQWAVLHEASKLLPSNLLFPLQLDFMKQLNTSLPPVSFYPPVERDLFEKAKERNMPEKFKHQLREVLKKHSDENKKGLERFVAQIAEYHSLYSRLSMFLKTPGRILLKVVVGLLIVLCATAAILSLFATSGASSADLISKNLVQIAMGLLISAIVGLGIVVALLLKSF